MKAYLLEEILGDKKKAYTEDHTKIVGIYLSEEKVQRKFNRFKAKLPVIGLRMTPIDIIDASEYIIARK